MKNIKTKNVHISQITNGDTVEHRGEMRTVNSSDIKRDNFMGVTLFGDSYNLGTKPVKRITFVVPKLIQ